MIESLLERLAGQRLDELFVPVGLSGTAPPPVEAELTHGALRWPASLAHAVASLVPLRLVLFPDRLEGQPVTPPGASLSLLLRSREGQPGAGLPAPLLGGLGLRLERELVLAGERLWLAGVDWAEESSRPRWAQVAGRLALEWRAWRSKSPMRVAPSTTLALGVLYLQPRPVHWVACQEGTAWDLFPMDLVGDPGGGRVSLALRKSSPANPVLARTRQVALAQALPGQVGLAYRQGKSHPLLGPDEDLGLPLATTPRLGLRVPEGSLARELTIEETLDLGSHTLFLARVLDGPAVAAASSAPDSLCHVQAAYQRRVGLGQRVARP